MPHLLLVDDDFLARNAIRRLLDQPSCPPCEVSEALDGREAVRLLSGGIAPDLALIDVNMPDMDGLALLSWIQTYRPGLRCVMLSSYSDFEYVRGALKKGAQDYLLKHQLTLDCLMDQLAQIGTPPFATPSAVVSPEKALTSFLSPTGSEIPELDFSKGYLLCTGSLPSTGTIDGAHVQSILQTCRHMLTETGTLVCLPQLPLLAMLRIAAPDSSNHIDTQQRMLSEAILRYHNVRIRWDKPVHCFDAADLRTRYLAALGSQIQVRDTAADSMSPVLAFETALTTAVLHNHQETIRQLIDEWFAQAAASNMLRAPESELTALLQKCSVQLLHREAGVLPPRLSAERACMHLTESFCALATEYQRMTHNGFPEIIRRTLTFLYEHMTTDIRLSDVAAHCNINYSYLSYLFKKETGIGITQYLNALRIHQCMRLILLQNTPIARVYENSGFKNHGHFYSVFKAITGIPPAQFKRSPDAIRYMMHFSPFKPTEYSKLP